MKCCVPWITRQVPKSPADRACPRHHRRSSKSSNRSRVGDKRQGGPVAVRIRQGTRRRRSLSPTHVVAWRALHRDAGERRPLITHLQDLAHLVEKFSFAYSSGASARSAKDRRSAAPDARRVRATGARYCRTDFFCRSDIAETKSAVESALLDNRRASAIRPTKNEFDVANGSRRLLIMWITDTN
jgi:hypothetical protein